MKTLIVFTILLTALIFACQQNNTETIKNNTIKDTVIVTKTIEVVQPTDEIYNDFLNFLIPIASPQKLDKSYIHFPLHLQYPKGECGSEDTIINVTEDNYKDHMLDLREALSTEATTEIMVLKDIIKLDLDGIENGIKIEVYFKKTEQRWVIFKYINESC